MALQLVTQISRSDLTSPRNVASATITDFEHLASYDWLNEDKPTISVPGSPPLWSPPKHPKKLEPDSGKVYIDQNAARSPEFPLEPLFRSLLAEQPDFEIGGVDLVTDRNNIRKLLRFVKGSSYEPFKIQVEIVNGKTAMFTRIQNESTEVIQGFRGYGRNFEKAYTTNPVGSSGHHRIVKYRFCGLRCVVRYEVDGYNGDAERQVARTEHAETLDTLPNLLETLRLSDSGPNPTNMSMLAIQRRGEVIASSSILEIKTRAASKSLDMSEVLPQLWISQTLQLVVGYHKNGIFNEVEVRDMAQTIRKWEASNEEDLSRLGNLLKRIIETLKDGGVSSAVVQYEGTAKLEIISSDPRKALPEDLYTKWRSQNDALGADTDAKEDQNKISGRTGSDVRGKTSVVIGDNSYNVQLAKFPYLNSLARSQADDSAPSEITHKAIPLFDVAARGVEAGFRQCFRALSDDVALYRALCSTYDLLEVDVCGGLALRDIIKDLKAGQDYESRNRPKARDAAFKLVYLMLQDDQSVIKDHNQVFNAVLFVVSHPRTFKVKTRKAVRAVYDSRHMSSIKQKSNLNQWVKNDNGVDEGDTTTEEEDAFDIYDSFDSDFS